MMKSNMFLIFGIIGTALFLGFSALSNERVAVNTALVTFVVR